jgi:hypothetical protein
MVHKIHSHRRHMHGGLGLYLSQADKDRIEKAKGAFRNLGRRASSAFRNVRTSASGAMKNVKSRYGTWQDERQLNKQIDALESAERAKRRAILRSRILSERSSTGVTGGARQRRRSHSRSRSHRRARRSSHSRSHRRARRSSHSRIRKHNRRSSRHRRH